MSLFNFLSTKPRSIPPWFVMLVLLFWISTIHHFFKFQRQEKRVPQRQNHIDLQQNSRIFQALQDISRLSFPECLLKKIEIYPHELLIFGKSLQESSIASVCKHLNLMTWSKQVEVKQWDYIKEKKWRFIIGVAY